MPQQTAKPRAGKQEAAAIPLTWGQVHTWRLGRQYLRERAPRDQMLDVITALGGIQAQVMSAAELQIAARVDDVTPADVRDALWIHHTLVKTWAMRGTLHLFDAREYPLLVGALSARKHYLRESWQKYFGVTAAEMETLIEAIGATLDGQCLTREQIAVEIERHTGSAHIAEELRSGWGTLLKPVAYRGDLCFGPSQGQTVTFVRPAQWIGPFARIDTATAQQTILRRYLAAYGPATRDDFALWWGMTSSEARRLFASLADELVEVDVEGWKAQALAATVESMQAPADPTLVRLLPLFDPLTIGVHYYRRTLPPDLKERVYRIAGWISPVVLVGGEIAGVWEYEQRRGRLVVQVSPFAPLSAAVQEGIAAEADRFGTFLSVPAEVTYV